MIAHKFKKTFAGISIGLLMLGQLAIISTGLLVPRKAEACVVLVVCNIEVGNIYDVLKDVGLGALRAVALDASNKFLTQFVSKLQEKYKIRNFLYYDQVLTDYYLNQYIADKISDPNLRQAYSLLQSAYVTGQSTGLPGQPDPRKAIIPQLKAAMSQIYLNQGGIPPNTVYNPAPGTTDAQYFANAQTYFANPQSFTQQNIYGQFGAFQSAATTASQLEITVGNGLKAGRIIGGTCSISASNNDPVSCQQAGGTWNASAVDMARSFIDNPTGTIDHYMSSAIQTKIDSNFNPNNFWAVIGSLVGNFLFNQLTLDQSTGTLSDAGPAYVATTPAAQTGKGIDIDGDGIIDGYDNTGSGQPDICIFGGIPVTNADGSVTTPVGPPCLGSKAASTVTPPPTTGGSDGPPAACSQQGINEENFILPLLNGGTDPAAAADQTNTKFNLATGSQAVYYSNNNTVGLPEFYAAGPTASRPVSPSTGKPWDIVVRCQ